MSDFPRNPVVPTHIHTWSRYSGLTALQGIGLGTSAGFGAWGSANVAVYIPLLLPWPYNIRRMFVNMGNSGSGGNYDIGIYTQGGVRLWSSGSTAMGTNSSLVYLTVSPDILLTPQTPYFLGFVEDNVVANRFYGMVAANLTANPGRAIGLLSQASAFPLPATATFAAYASTAATGAPFCGFTNTDSGY